MTGDLDLRRLYTLMGFTSRNPTDSHFEELGRTFLSGREIGRGNSSL